MAVMAGEEPSDGTAEAGQRGHRPGHPRPRELERAQARSTESPGSWARHRPGGTEAGLERAGGPPRSSAEKVARPAPWGQASGLRAMVHHTPAPITPPFSSVCLSPSLLAHIDLTFTSSPRCPASAQLTAS